MKNVLSSIEYKGIFKYFEEICSIPHGSRNNKGISDFLVSFAKARRLKCKQDEFLNVVIIKEATKGYEDKPTLIIQGHMDMVCEKNPDIEFDFMKQGLDLRINGDYVYAEGTTLGGDDGIAIAYALAILDDNTIVHPRLEIVITTDEEIGMDGAAGLDTSDLQGKYMLNIDSEEEGIILSSSAGGLTGTCRLPLVFEERDGITISLSIQGLQGGHSGTEIQKNRTNASILMGRFLFELGKTTDYQLINIKGGLKDNSIPRESTAELLIDEKDRTVFHETVENLKTIYKYELKTSEPGLLIDAQVNLERSKNKVLNADSLRKVLFMLQNTPNGVQVNSSDIDGLVESSLNLGILKIEEDKAYFCYSVRSSIGSYKHFLSARLQNLIEFLGGDFTIRGEYEPWEYRKDSKLRDILVKVYKKEYGNEPKVEAIHAGLECGIISGKMKNLDIASLGPNILDIHTPQEKLSISSAKRVYDYLIQVFKEICEGNNE